MYDWAQKAVDAVHLAGNGVGFGLPDWLATQATGNAAGVAANTARAQANLGTVGDLISGAGTALGIVRGGGLAKSALKAIPGLLAAAPVAEAAAADAGATGSAFRAELAARQAANVTPNPLTVAATAFKANPLKATALAALPVLMAGGANASRTGLTHAAAAGALSPTDSPIPGGPSYADLSAKANAISGGVDGGGVVTTNPGGLGDLPATSPFGGVIQAFAGANGGGLSLHQLASLAQAQAHVRAPAVGYQKKPQTAADKNLETLNAVNDAMWQKESTKIEAMPSGDEKNKAYTDALERHRLRLESAGKINPVQEAIGAGMNGLGPVG